MSDETARDGDWITRFLHEVQVLDGIDPREDNDAWFEQQAKASAMFGDTPDPSRIREVQQLIDEGFITGRTLGRSSTITGLGPNGRRRLGLWPSETEELRKLLVDVLDKLVENAPDDAKEGIGTARRLVLDATASFLGSVAAGMTTGR